MLVEIEAKTYGPDSTPEEVAALRARVSHVEPGYILYREIPCASEFHLNLLFDRVEELAQAHGCHYMLVDLSESRRPNAEQRRQLKQRLKSLGEAIHAAAIFTEKNVLLTTAARFVVAGVPQRVTVHRTRQQAVAALEAARRG